MLTSLSTPRGVKILHRINIFNWIWQQKVFSDIKQKWAYFFYKYEKLTLLFSFIYIFQNYINTIFNIWLRLFNMFCLVSDSLQYILVHAVVIKYMKSWNNYTIPTLTKIIYKLTFKLFFILKCIFMFFTDLLKWSPKNS